MQTFTADKEQQCEQEIISGRYNIHKRDWSAEEEKLRASRAEHSRNTAEVPLNQCRFCTPNGSYKKNWKWSRARSKKENVAIRVWLRRSTRLFSRECRNNARICFAKRRKMLRRLKKNVQNSNAKKKNCNNAKKRNGRQRNSRKLLNAWRHCRKCENANKSNTVAKLLCLRKRWKKKPLPSRSRKITISNKTKHWRSAKDDLLRSACCTSQLIAKNSMRMQKN